MRQWSVCVSINEIRSTTQYTYLSTQSLPNSCSKLSLWQRRTISHVSKTRATSSYPTSFMVDGDVLKVERLWKWWVGVSIPTVQNYVSLVLGAERITTGQPPKGRSTKTRSSHHVRCILCPPWATTLCSLSGHSTLACKKKMVSPVQQTINKNCVEHIILVIEWSG